MDASLSNHLVYFIVHLTRRESSSRDYVKVMEHTHGMMEADILVAGVRVSFMVMAHESGTMADATVANGERAWLTGKELKQMLMAVSVMMVSGHTTAQFASRKDPRNDAHKISPL